MRLRQGSTTAAAALCGMFGKSGQEGLAHPHALDFSGHGVSRRSDSGAIRSRDQCAQDNYQDFDDGFENVHGV